MQNRPDMDVLLAAVIRFLEQDVKPRLSDPALGFRALVAASLLKTVRADLGQIHREDLQKADVPLPDELGCTDAALVESVRAGKLSVEEQRAARGKIKEGLKQQLQRLSPHFDLSNTID